MHVSNKIICVSVLEGLNLTTKIVQIKLYLMKALDHHDINLFVDFLFINQYYNSVIQKKKKGTNTMCSCLFPSKPKAVQNNNVGMLSQVIAIYVVNS